MISSGNEAVLTAVDFLEYLIDDPLIETLADVALRALPLRDGDAEAMIAETRAGALLAGHRGRPPGDVEALVRCLIALADFAWSERDHLVEIDVNPIVVRERGRGRVVVDALIVPRGAAVPPGSFSA